MNTDFETLYRSVESGAAGKLERERRRYVRKIYGCGITLIAGTTAAYFVLGNVALVVGIPLMILLPIAADFLALRFYDRLFHVYTAEVAPELVRLIDDRLSYDRYAGLQSYYTASCLYTEAIDSCACEDTITGRIGNTSFAFGEMHTTFTSNYEINGTKRVKTIFRGIFFVAEFNRHLSHETIVLPDRLESVLGTVGRHLQKHNSRQSGKLMQLENPEFEKAFAVYSTNEQESRYVLTPGMMEKILLLHRKLGGSIRLSFKGNYIYVACDSPANWFKISVFRPVLRREDLRQLMAYIRIMTGIVEDLNLNTRIWTKE